MIDIKALITLKNNDKKNASLLPRNSEIPSKGLAARLGSERFKDGRTSPPTSRLLYPAYALNKVVDAGQAPEVCQPSTTKGKYPK